VSYAQPAQQGDKVDFKNRGHEFLGKLFLIFPDRVMTDVETSQGAKDRVVVADVVIIDLIDPQTGQPEVYTESWIFPTVLVNQTAPEIGGKVLGRLTQGANTKGSPPWMLTDYTPQDAALAEQYEASHPRNAPAQPSGNGQQWQAPPPAAPAQNGWNAPAPAPVAPPAAPAQQGWQPPAAAPVAPPVGAELDPNLKVFLEQRGVKTEGLNEATAKQIAASFPA
jgi:hypothetical protein